MSQPAQPDPIGERAVDLDARQDERRVLRVVPLRPEARHGLGGGEARELAASLQDDDRQPGLAQEERVARAGDAATDDDDVGRRRQASGTPR